MPVGQQQVQRVVEQRALVEAGVPRGGQVRRRDDHCQVGLVGEEQLEALLGVRLDDPHGDVRVPPAEVGGHLRQQGRGGGEKPQTRSHPDCSSVLAATAERISSHWA